MAGPGFVTGSVPESPAEWHEKMADVKIFHLKQFHRAEALFGLVGILTFPSEDFRLDFRRKWEKTEIKFRRFQQAFETYNRDRTGWRKLKRKGIAFQDVLIPFLDVCHAMATSRGVFSDEVEQVAHDVQNMDLGFAEN